MTKEAKDYAVLHVAHFVKTKDVVKQTPGQVFLWWQFRCRYEDVDGQFVLTAPAENLPWMCHLAATNEDARAIVRDMVASKLRANLPLSRAEALFAGNLLSDLLPALPRSKRGKKLTDNFERNVFIVMLARQLRGLFALDHSRNDDPKPNAPPKVSSADVISEAFIEQGRHEVTYRAVKEVLMNVTLRRYVDALERAILAAHNQEHPISNALATPPSVTEIRP